MRRMSIGLSPVGIHPRSDCTGERDLCRAELQKPCGKGHRCSRNRCGSTTVVPAGEMSNAALPCTFIHSQPQSGSCHPPRILDSRRSRHSFWSTTRHVRLRSTRNSGSNSANRLDEFCTIGNRGGLEVHLKESPGSAPQISMSRMRSASSSRSAVWRRKPR